MLRKPALRSPLADPGDLDAAIFDYLRTASAPRTASAARGADLRPRPATPSTSGDLRASRALRDDIRQAEEMLPRTASAHVHVPRLEDDVPIGRELLARPLLDRTVAVTGAALRAAGAPRSDVEAIFLVGGSSRIPLAATLLHQEFGIAPTVVENPESVVARGALLVADLLTTAAPASPAGPGPAFPTTPPPPSSSSRRRLPLFAALGAVMAVVVLLAAVLLVVNLTGNDDGQRTLASSPTSRSRRTTPWSAG
ncbi:Hsp70 family protein [Cryptosporangium phraense]|uniref:Hsp70 family protein n=1 Tax=Cryptosporangium phraense TaxID=2593070 RepID=A0A545APQ7_9ACTN|nr:Hsp70 family protein [Cryptosporangium phraense]TQS42715.1 Hsp70 family protein [Cryptosporangium phraense]